MQPEHRSIPSLDKVKLQAPFTARPGAKTPGTKAQATESLTAKMLDYRSWWNLPRSRSKKPA